MPIGRPGFHHEKKLHPGEQNVSHNWAVQEFHGSFRVSKAGKFHHMGHLLQQQQQLLLINSSVDSKKYLVLVVVVVVLVVVVLVVVVVVVVSVVSVVSVVAAWTHL